MPHMTLDQALVILAKVHTRDSERAGFFVDMGARPAHWENLDDYVTAWGVVREVSGLRVKPEQYPARTDEQKGNDR